MKNVWKFSAFVYFLVGVLSTPTWAEETSISQNNSTEGLLPFIDVYERGISEISESDEWTIREATSLQLRGIETGTFGTCVWTFNTVTGVLSIGSGTMQSGRFQKVSSSVKKIIFTGPVIAAQDSSNLFQGMSELTEIENMHYLDVSSLITGRYMFSGCSSLTALDVSNWDTSSLSDATGMFSGSNVTILDVSNWDTSSLKNARDMFFYCDSLTALDVSNWDTSSLSNAQYMFANCSSLATLDVLNWDVSSTEFVRDMFFDCSSLTTLDVSNWDTSSLSDTIDMFAGCSSLTTLDVSNWNTKSLSEVAGMFAGCSSLNALDVSKWNTHLFNYGMEMFLDCSSLTTLNVSSWDTSSLTQAGNMFAGCNSLITLDVSNWDTSSISDMSYMFADCSKLKILDVSKWNTSSVGSASFIFSNCSSLTTLDLSNWNLEYSGGEYKFQGCLNLKELVLGSNWQFYDRVFEEDGFSDDLYIPQGDERYSGRWRNVGSGSTDNPTGSHIFTSSSEFMKNYDGKTMAGTYVWEPSVLGEITITADCIEIPKNGIVNWTVSIGNNSMETMDVDLVLFMPVLTKLTYVSNSSKLDGVAVSDVQLDGQSISVGHFPTGTKTWTFQTKASGEMIGELLEVSAKVNLIHSNHVVSFEADGSVKLANPDVTVIPAGKTIDIDHFPSHFTFETTPVKSVKQHVGLDQNAYDPYTVENGLLVGVTDERYVTSKWRLMAKLAPFRENSNPTRTLDSAVDITINASIEQENQVYTPSENTVILQSDNTEVLVMENSTGNEAGSWNLLMPLKDIHLTIPANVGIAEKTYTSELIWSLYEVP